jgi:TonB-linked SusC/RagA family outer membrane protein
MKISFFGILIQCMLFSLLSASDGTAQKRLMSVKEVFISVNIKNATLAEAFQLIEKQTSFIFNYDLRHIENQSPIDIFARKKSVADILLEISEKANLKFKQVNNSINVERLDLDDRNNNIEKMEIIIQTRTITGKVTSQEDPEGLPGVNVIEKYTSNGTVTNVNGVYSLNVSEGATLVFSSVGYTREEVLVGNMSVIDLVMNPDIKQLEELVVVGYGTQKKENLTGAVGTVSSQEIISRPAPNTTTLLQGRVPGVQIVQNSAQPGNEGANIQIRGMGTYSGGGAGNNPLVLIDGVEGNLNNLNPNMIENVSVLKDAGSAAIYGTRAANGVILITTKTGNEGRLNVEYSYNQSYQEATSLYERVTNSVEFMELLNKAIDHTGTNTNQRYPQSIIDEYREGAISDPERYPSFDWIDAIFRTAPMQQHFLSVNGGKDGTVYNFGLGYMDQEGILIATGHRKYDAHLNFRTRLAGRVSFGSNMNFFNSDRWETALNNNFDGNTTEDQILSALSANPTFKPYLPDGSGRYAASAYAFEGGNKGPIAISENGGRDIKRYYGLLSSFINVDILPGLTGELKGSVKLDDAQTKVHVIGIPTYLYQPGADGTHQPRPAWNGTVGENNLTVRTEKDVQLTWWANLRYNKTFSNAHNVGGLLGFNQESFRYDRLQGLRRNAPVDYVTELDGYQSAGQITEGQAYEWALRSVFGRINYDYEGRYLLESNFRFDATSRFPKGKRWGFFPSASAGWRISEESFFQGQRWVDDLKLRISWGELGNQNITNYPYQKILSPYEYNIGGVLQQGVTPTHLINEDLRWETTSITNAGIDFSLMKSKVYGSFDMYRKYTKDILASLTVPQFIGLSQPTVNLGEVKNTGMELVLGHRNNIGGFNYSIQGNFDTYKNELVKYGPRTFHNSNISIREEGLPIDSYFIWIFDGIYQNANEIAEGPTPLVTPKPGDMKYKDVNGDGKVNAEDRVVVSGAFPKFNYGFNFTADYKSLDISLFFQGVEGKKTYVREWGIAPFRQASPPPTLWRNAWNGEGTSNTIPHIFNENYGPNTQLSTWWLQDASYLRLKSLQFGYNFPKTMVNKIAMQNLRIYFSGDNLFTFTKFFKGGDPERAALNSRMAIYPQARIYSIGVKTIF